MEWPRSWSISTKLTKLLFPVLCTQCEVKGLLCNEEKKYDTSQDFKFGFQVVFFFLSAP